jgi:hypothetical protein
MLKQAWQVKLLANGQSLLVRNWLAHPAQALICGTRAQQKGKTDCYCALTSKQLVIQKQYDIASSFAPVLRQHNPI